MAQRETRTLALDEDLRLHLARLDLWIRRAVLLMHARVGLRADEEFRGLYISRQDVGQLLDSDAASVELGADGPALPEEVQKIDEGLALLELKLRELNLPDSRLNRLMRSFGLSTWDRDVVVACLASEVDLRFERLYSYLQDDVTRKQLTIDLVLRLLCSTTSERLEARQRFESGSPLLAWELVTLEQEQSGKRPSTLARVLRLDERIARFLLGSDGPDGRLLPLIRVSKHLPRPVVDEEGAAQPKAVREQVRRLGGSWREGTPGAEIILLAGRYGTGKEELAREIATSAGIPVLFLDAGLAPESGLPWRQLVRVADREALLRGGFTCWQSVGFLLRPSSENVAGSEAFVRALSEVHSPTLLLSEDNWVPGRALRGRRFLALELSAPAEERRNALWQTRLQAQGIGLPEAVCLELAARYRLTPGQMEDAIEQAQVLGWSRGLQEAPELADLEAACRAQAQPRLAQLARRVEQKHGWEDLVLPQGQLNTLKMVSAAVRQRLTVYGQWGFDRKMSSGKGVICLFSGVSGTGKTMSAGIIAADLGLELYRIDLSSVVSKYIGETEKNLERIFSEAQHSDAVLFFDEADALFGKRSEVKDAHDRYANLEVAYLLQRVEDYNGLVILATNIKKNLDEAFARRLHFVIDFPMPEEAERLEIWKRSFPLRAPRSPDLDFSFLATRHKLSGGNIRNIVLGAAFMAAEERRSIGMGHMICALAQELQKLGKMVVPADFGPYFELLKVPVRRGAQI